jgi:hypothetical protein
VGSQIIDARATQTNLTKRNFGTYAVVTLRAQVFVSLRGLAQQRIAMLGPGNSMFMV